MKLVIIDYILAHWRGDLPYWQAFWVNLILFGIIWQILYLLLFWTSLQILIALFGVFSIPTVTFVLILGSAFFVTLGWQMIGIQRNLSKKQKR